ncbi:thiamine-phosphate pyrophosphorylase [Aquibacillus albus]|uniref:Thiamine-phosphate synthase n=2 Tax=Aquibacillus albus TaxID=1168171 RepID=A0ABS2MZR8_9BACI|nr:thiamine-phosphate pyrophosphorylase [Aquibacillus albus]
MKISEMLRVYFIMGSNNCTGDPLEVLESALKGGITLFQLREKGANAKTGKKKKELALKMKELCHRYEVPFVVNDDVSLALEIEADGIHVGQDDEPVSEIKEKCPERMIIGVSATNGQEAVEAVKDGADYIGVGPIFSTDTKVDAKKPIGLEGVSRIRKLVGDIPMVAIGGIKAVHASDIIDAGADGVSVITAISAAASPEAAAREIKEKIGE